MKKGSFKNMKNLNMKNVLTLIKDHQGISRADIAKKVNLSRASVTNIVNELLELKLVKEVRAGKSSGGRRPILLDLNPDGGYVIGLEWGISKLKAVLLNLEAEILAKKEIIPSDNSLEEYTKKSFALIDKFISTVEDEAKITGIAVGIHGLVDPEKGVSLFTPHFGWGKVEIEAIIAENYDYPVFIDNDVRMMAEGEIWQGKKDFIFINTGSGVGAALVFAAKLHYGVNNAAGEFGHIKITDDAPVCECGKKGCLESLIAEARILNRYYNKLDSKLERKELSIEKLVKDYKKGSSKAVETIKEISEYFSRGIADLVNLLNPEAVVIGGLFAAYSEVFLAELKNNVSDKALILAVENLNITTAHYGEYAGAVGAAEKVLNNFFKVD
ncbi:ROK family transcriptional regulator [Halanaerobium sp. Z-7514]|uniref:ROK family transcriptional regulator n=1 Tax=Halanaerobium polyolivorans TaxID=2886943 RepID=A0AAW4X1M7_9FIRM|nr:ROK family transcriptional regulator [Halanaerobium polyolivorans]MCC3145734.1 ROK family transcriptional regulator [Halanaerobium polyolivorans]